MYTIFKNLIIVGAFVIWGNQIYLSYTVGTIENLLIWLLLYCLLHIMLRKEAEEDDLAYKEWFDDWFMKWKNINS